MKKPKPLSEELIKDVWYAAGATIKKVGPLRKNAPPEYFATWFRLIRHSPSQDLICNSRLDGLTDDDIRDILSLDSDLKKYLVTEH